MFCIFIATHNNINKSIIIFNINIPLDTINHQQLLSIILFFSLAENLINQIKGIINQTKNIPNILSILSCKLKAPMNIVHIFHTIIHKKR